MDKHDQQTEQRILQAATEVFIEKGQDGARMEEIAQRAGINKALLHYYFRSKKQLFRKVFQQEVNSFFQTIFQSLRPELELEDFLCHFIDTYIDLLIRKPYMPRFIVWEVLPQTDLFKEIIVPLLSSVSPTPVDIVTEKIETAKRQGRIRNVDSLQLIVNIVGMVLFAFIGAPIIEQIQPGIKVLSEDFLQKRKAEIKSLVLNGIKK
ncbi:MAG: hypothetical protein Kow0037_20070 [Calditrichia bacterium]